MHKQNREILSVSELNQRARGVLEINFPLLWVTGEISNLARPSSGHLYFSLKDASAQVRCALFRGNARLLDFKPADGQQVTVRARVSLYEGRGEFQLIIEYMEEAGSGALQRRFELLKKRLHAEGLFDPRHKKQLPTLARRIGVITSPSGAAIRDVLSVLKRRFPGIAVRIYPVPVQGAEAPREIVKALENAARRQDCEVLLLTRGGGSLEDLWAFNEEAVARAVYACPLPVVSAVGHEIDFTICDFTADQRAPTPSAAAELLSPDAAAWQKHLAAGLERTRRAVLQQVEYSRRHLSALEKRMQHPARILQNLQQRADNLELRLRNAMQSKLREQQQRCANNEQRLYAHTPRQQLAVLIQRREYLRQRLIRSSAHFLAQPRRRLEALSRALELAGPRAVLQRGYAIVSDVESGRVLRAVEETQVGAKLRVRLAEGELLCEVVEI